MSTSNTQRRTDVYTRVTDKIIADLENGVRTWMKPWSVTHTAGKITRPLRHSGDPVSGRQRSIALVGSRSNGYAAPIWMTYKQATDFRRTCPQRRARRNDGCLRRPLHETETDEPAPRPSRDPVPEGLYRLQRGADRRPAAALPRAAETRCR